MVSDFKWLEMWPALTWSATEETKPSLVRNSRSSVAFHKVRFSRVCGADWYCWLYMVWESASKMLSSLLVSVCWKGYWESGKKLETSYWNIFFRFRMSNVSYLLLDSSFGLATVQKCVSIMLITTTCTDYVPYHLFQNF